MSITDDEEEEAAAAAEEEEEKDEGLIFDFFEGGSFLASCSARSAKNSLCSVWSSISYKETSGCSGTKTGREQLLGKNLRTLSQKIFFADSYCASVSLFRLVRQLSRSGEKKKEPSRQGGKKTLKLESVIKKARQTEDRENA